jgi:hypothetical protein
MHTAVLRIARRPTNSAPSCNTSSPANAEPTRM